MIKFKDLNLRSKLNILLFIALIISLGIAILIYNSETKIREINKTLALFYDFEVRLLNVEVNLEQINLLANKISDETDLSNFYYHKRQLEDLKINAYNYISVEDTAGIIASLSRFKGLKELSLNFIDTLLMFKNRYDKIFTSLSNMIYLKSYVLDQERIRDDYLIFLEQRTDLKLKYYGLDSVDLNKVVEDITKALEKDIVKHKAYIEQQVNLLKGSSYLLLELFNSEILNLRSQSEKIHTKNLILSSFIFVMGIFIVLIFSSIFVNSIFRPIQDIIFTLEKLSYGVLPDIKFEERYDEVGLISENLEKLIFALRETSKFAQALGKGNFDYPFKPLSDEDVLGSSLLEMKQSLLQAVKEEEKRKKEDYIRNRSAEATALFADILRKYQDNLEKLGDEVIINLVRFFNANQGVFFIINDDDEKHPYLELLSAYAWNRKKYLEKRIELGEGLVGAVAIEKFTVYMTDVPEDYIEIRSGTGDANPTSILIVPLKTQDEVLGVIEIASFYEFEPYEIELIENIAESIASTLKNAKISKQTADLLEKFQIQAAEMKEQEMIMKKTIDQLQKTQEESRRKEQELQKTLKDLEVLNKQLLYKDEQLKREVELLRKENEEKIKRLLEQQKFTQQIFEATFAGFMEVDKDDNILFVNKAALEMLGYEKDELKKMKLRDLFILILPEGKNMYEYFTENDEFVSTGKELKIKTKDNKTLDVLVQVIKSNFEEKIVVAIKDLSFIKEKEKETLKSMEEYFKNELLLLKRVEQLEEVLKEHNLEIPKTELDDKILVTFSDKFKLGIETIDKQHKRWFDFVNKVYEALQKHEAIDKLNTIFQELIDYTNYHFGFEEKYMKDFNLPILEEHKKKHQKFVDDLRALYEEYSSGKVDVPYKLVLFLKRWVESHVLNDDRKYVEDFKKHGLK